jgi:proline racemase
MRASRVVHTIDSHTCGEPTRVVTGGVVIRGATLLEQREHLRTHHDGLRRALLCEPRGHRGMFGAFLVPPTRTDVDFGVVWFDNAGWLNMCGHGTLGLGVTLVETGMVTAREPLTTIRLDTPAGPVLVEAEVRAGRATGAAFVNVPAFVLARDVAVEVPGRGAVALDVTFGGSFFGAVRAEALGIEVRPENARALADAGVALRHAVNRAIAVEHPTLPHIRSVDLVTIWGPPTVAGAKYKCIHVFADGQFDRSPGGTGTSHMMALLIARGAMRTDEAIVAEGLIGTTFGGRIVGETRVGDYPAIVPRVSGTAYITGVHQFLFDPDDPLRDGFLVG